MGGLQQLCPGNPAPASVIPCDHAHDGHDKQQLRRHIVRRDSRAAKINHCDEALAIPFCSNR
jgi:hypothetical protein